MDKNDILEDIFNNDPLGLLDFKTKNSNIRTADERLLASFQEISDFVKSNEKEPERNLNNISEFQLASRLENLREDTTRIALLKEHDLHNLLPAVEVSNESGLQDVDLGQKEINSIDDILENDSFELLGGDTQGVFDLKHVSKISERSDADFVARRKPCKDFDKYESCFKNVQLDLASGNRELIGFNENQLMEGRFFVHNGILLLLDKVIGLKKDKFGKQDGRTRIVFENGTESGMKLRSLGKNLFANGRAVTTNSEDVDQDFANDVNSITNDDEEAGYIYVLKSKSKDEKIASIQDLYKIGYSKIDVRERIKNAEKEPTYLMAPVSIKGAWKCFNMNPQKLEQLLHNFFGNSCLELDLFDEKGKRHNPREWFIAPINVIEQAIDLVINRKIVDYEFDAVNMTIVERI